ncbi:MAG: YvcK family protein [Candidatus Diapherotrites archaeon]|nr:YvcK family protein [Candidatus Diapherotrites archaeon]
MRGRNGPKIVAIGGGTGTPNILRGLKKYTENLTAIVNVTDAGRSSGKLRKELNIAPPGDVRNCLIALADSDHLLYDLFQYRFADGKTLAGYSFGNLFIAALTKMTGSFSKALEQSAKILAIRGAVIPSTLQNVHICARLADGRIVKGEPNVRNFGKVRIAELFLDRKNVKAAPGAINAIKKADLVVIGPGSLHTSVLSNFLVSGIAKAVRESRAKKVYVCNIVTQPGLTDDFDAADHVNEVLKYLGRGALDYAIINGSKPPRRTMKKYEMDNAFLVKFSKEGIERAGVKPIVADLLEKSEKRKPLWEKMYWLRHDSEKLARVLVGLINGAE